MCHRAVNQSINPLRVEHIVHAVHMILNVINISLREHFEKTRSQLILDFITDAGIYNNILIYKISYSEHVHINLLISVGTNEVRSASSVTRLSN